MHVAQVVEHTAKIVFGATLLGGPIPLPDKVVADFTGIYGLLRRSGS